MFAVLLTTLFLAAAWGQGEPYTFDEEMPWGSQVGPVIRVMEGLGYKTETTFLNDDQALVFTAEGELAYAYFDDDDRLLNVTLYILTSAITADNTTDVQFSATEAGYEEVKKGLLEAYGQPTLDVAEFEAPYARGDGREIEAIKNDKATFITGWENPGSTGGVFLFLDQDADIAISWEAPGWDAHLEASE
jgi:hypothetical protein